MTVVALWLATIQAARFADIPVIIAVVVAALATTYCFDRYLWTEVRIGIVVVMIVVLVDQLLPKIH
jgi:hypothetical protein